MFDYLLLFSAAGSEFLLCNEINKRKMRSKIKIYLTFLNFIIIWNFDEDQWLELSN